MTDMSSSRKGIKIYPSEPMKAPNRMMLEHKFDKVLYFSHVLIT